MKSTIIFIGDFKDPGIPELLESFVLRYSDNYEIEVSGYNFSYIKDTDQIHGKYSICSLSSTKHIYHKHIAEYVVITTAASRHSKFKKNQKTIYILSEFDKKTFAGCIGEISQLITDNEDVYNEIQTDFKHINACLYKKLKSDSIFSEIVDLIDIEPGIHKEAERYLVVSANENDEMLMDRFGVGHYLSMLNQNPANGIIAMTIKNNSVEIASKVSFNASLLTKAVLSEFNGTILFESEYIRSYFEAFVLGNDITLNADRQMLFSDFQLVPLEKAVRRYGSPLKEDESNAPAYVKYRLLLDKLYMINGCESIKVSVIICRYNTPIDLLERAIRSALNSGHQNTEVIVVDDGSKDNIELNLAKLFQDDRLFYYYKENEGPGLSRNYGVEKATGKYVFYLDSDDTIHEKGLPLLLSHITFFDLDMVIGKRILCDQDGIVMNESLSYLAGELFKIYYQQTNQAEIYTDVMINNRLIKRQKLIDCSIKFSRGLYEDVEYSACLYSTLDNYHYLSIPVHDWYQYGKNTTISSSENLNNLRERIIKEESAWNYIPEQYRKRRLFTILSSDFNMYFRAFFRMPEKDQEHSWELIKRFVLARSNYLEQTTYPEKIKELANAILSGNKGYFEYVISRFYMPPQGEEPADDYVILTHYHLFRACLNAIRNKRKSRLYICQSYIPFSTNIVYNIRKTGLFETVQPFVYGDLVVRLFEALEKRPGEEDIIIPNSLYGRFRELFIECNPQIDTLYIFSDSHPYWYYLEREFKNIVKFEDAYNSFDREVKTHEIQGIWAGISQYQGGIFPLMFYRSDKISKIVVSKKPMDIPAYYYDKIEIEDAKLLEKEHYEEIKKVMLGIYDVDPALFTKDTTLLLTQPLALFGYCTEKEQKKLMKKMCDQYKGSPILVKPHPADNMNYKYLGGTILPKNVPIEIYNYMDVRIARAITFGSSAIETIEFADENKAYFKLHDFTFEDVVVAIKDLIREEPPSLKKRVKRKIRRIIRKRKA